MRREADIRKATLGRRDALKEGRREVLRCVCKITIGFRQSSHLIVKGPDASLSVLIRFLRPRELSFLPETTSVAAGANDGVGKPLEITEPSPS